MKWMTYLFLAAFGGLLIFATLGMPNQGDPKAANHREIGLGGSQVASVYYVRNAYKDTHTPNMVTAILADYRSFDTLGEEVVIFASGLVCFMLLRRRKGDE